MFGSPVPVLQLLRSAHRVIVDGSDFSEDGDAIVTKMLALLQKHDSNAMEHAFGVALQANAMALMLDLSPNIRLRLWRGALLHDIGKLGVPLTILHKSSSLTDAEFVAVRRHPVMGAQLISQSLALKPAATIIRHHHERWDGKGYPDRLRGEAIPMEARIVGLCDAVHVMTMNRPYRSALSSQDILHELDRCAGSQFDPRLVSLLKEAKSFRK